MLVWGVKGKIAAEYRAIVKVPLFHSSSQIVAFSLITVSFGKTGLLLVALATAKTRCDESPIHRGPLKSWSSSSQPSENPCRFRYTKCGLAPPLPTQTLRTEG